MEKRQLLWKTKGMNKDLSVSAFKPEFAFENMNLRLSTNEHNTLMSWVNERGTERIDIKKEGDTGTPLNIEGTPVGTAVIDHQLIVFTHNEVVEDNITIYTDKIYLLKKYQSNNFVGKVLYSGDLNLRESNPLETLVSYEMDTVEKVYWVDGRNQPRVINIKGNVKEGVDTQFDFVPALGLNESLGVTKNNGSGLFAPGVIQYGFTYVNRFGQETNMVAVSPLNYITHTDRGARQDEMVSTSFFICVDDADLHFDYIRFYSIHRSSLNGVPSVRLVADIKLEDTGDLDDSKIQYTDNGTVGSAVDPESLLFIGGKEITAFTLIDKDKTLFLGNIEERNSDISNIQDWFDNNITSNFIQYNAIKRVSRDAVSSFYSHVFQLNYNKRQITTFKGGEIYRFGFQLQKKTGEWSEPILIGDFKNSLYPDSKVYSDSIDLITASGDIPVTKQVGGETKTIIDVSVYKKIRPLIVYPTIGNRQVLCQGVLNPTIFNVEDRIQKLPFAQASWFFRPYLADEESDTIGSEHNPSRGAVFTHYDSLPCWNGDTTESSAKKATNLEVQGAFKIYESAFDQTVATDVSSNNQFFVDQSIVTLNSPDIDFDTELQNLSLEGAKLRIVGAIPVTGNASAHKIETSSGMVALGWNNGGDDSSYGAGELDINTLYNNIDTKAGNRLISNFIWNDAHFKAEGSATTPQTANYAHNFLIYPWQRTGPLNNDYREQSVASSWLKKKMESNLLYSINTEYFPSSSAFDYGQNISTQLHLTENDFISNIRLPQQKSTSSDINYYPNIDKILHTEKIGQLNGYPIASQDLDPNDVPYKWSIHHITALPVSMRYKSTSHAVIAFNAYSQIENKIPILPYGTLGEGASQITYGKFDPPTPLARNTFWGDTEMVFHQEPIALDDLFVQNNNHRDHNWLWLGELYRDVPNPFGDRTDRNAILSNNWVIGGNIKDLETDVRQDGTTTVVPLDWTEGDTYFQRYDCLKTYAFSPEDTNQLVEILSFMVETHVNLDGRYDKNRGQQVSYTMSPQNFNLLNPVYSQQDNFFSYKKADIETQNKKYPNQIAYSLTKTSGADVDAWTNVNLGSVLELDGDKGPITKLARLDDKLIAFQDSGISQILYNESVQVESTAGAPIEIANSGKVQGARYISGTVGCSNKWSIAQTPSGLYFMDSNDKSIYLLGDGLKNITQIGGFNTWAKNNISTYKEEDGEPLSAGAFKAFYDRLNQEVLFINQEKALAWSERIGAFTSFYDYGNTPYFINLDDEGYWLNTEQTINSNSTDYKLWKHQGGNYCKFFGVNKEYYTTLIGNAQPQADKIFTNLEFRACVEGEGVPSLEKDADGNPVKFTPSLPFTHLETWNEYQHGYTQLSYKNGHSAMLHHTSDMNSSLKRKFRMWRCDIPRNNCLLDDDPNRRGSEPYSTDAELGISRYVKKPQDRMRNPWMYLKLKQDAINVGGKTEIHDVVLTYFG